MPNFILIDPTTKSIHNYACNDWRDAARAVGLDPTAVDHGTVACDALGGYGILVYEWGLKTPLVDSYFALNRQLFNGPAVIYAFDAEGETIDCPPSAAEHIRQTHLMWLDSREKAEGAIVSGFIDRPQSSINDQVFWQWNK